PITMIHRPHLIHRRLPLHDHPILRVEETVDHQCTPSAHHHAPGAVHGLAALLLGHRGGSGSAKYHDPRGAAPRDRREIMPVRDRTTGEDDEVARDGQGDVAGGSSEVNAAENPERVVDKHRPMESLLRMYWKVEHDAIELAAGIDGIALIRQPDQLVEGGV